jgi:enoyl-CoA hydratase/carnithine racemase
MDLEFIEYEQKDAIACITLNRADKHNSQHTPLLDELDACWQRAAADDDVRVIVIKAHGKNFSAGHDLTGYHSERLDQLEREGGWDSTHQYRHEAEHFLGYCLRWRNVPKPSIAAVQGKCIAAGLMLCWPCDLIVASDDAQFSDPVVAMGIGGVEYHAHTWEFGARKAKEILFTGSVVSAREALELGMVNRVVPRGELETAAFELAGRIAVQDPFALFQAKRIVNQTLDIVGFTSALQAAFDVHELGHAAQRSRVGTTLRAGGATLLEDMKQVSRENAPTSG